MLLFLVGFLMSNGAIYISIAHDQAPHRPYSAVTLHIHPQTGALPLQW